MVQTPSSSYRDDINNVEMTIIDDHEDSSEGQFMLGEGAKTESVERSNCRKWPYIFLVMILLTVAGVGYVNKNDVDIAMAGKLLHMSSSDTEPSNQDGVLVTDTSEHMSKESTPNSLAISTDNPTNIPSYLPTKQLIEVTGTVTEAIKQQQIDNYIAGEALILNIHITHHAGTSVCAKMSQCGPTPSFACMNHKHGDSSPWPSDDPKLNKYALEYKDAELMVDIFRPYVHFMSLEYPKWGNLHVMNWEYPRLVSMIVMRHPLDRFLAGGKCGASHNTVINEADPTPENEKVQRLYWEYANDKCADNYALRVLAVDKNCDGDSMKDCFNTAKALLRRFTFILDEDCLDESMEAMGNQLRLNITSSGFESKFHHYHATARERINNDTLYEFLLDKFHYDIELYEWSKDMSVLKCSDLAYDSVEPSHAPSDSVKAARTIATVGDE